MYVIVFTDESNFVSLHIHFMEGDYDETLQWPFKGELTFTIVHPLRPQESLTECIRSKPEASAVAFHKATRKNPYGFGKKKFNIKFLVYLHALLTIYCTTKIQTLQSMLYHKLIID